MNEQQKMREQQFRKQSKERNKYIYTTEEGRKHKIVCGDFLEISHGMENETIDLIVTSPPYFMYKEIDYFEEYTEYLNFLFRCIDEFIRILKPRRHLIINVDDAHHTISKDGNESFPTHAILINYIWQQKQVRYKDTIIWAKIRGAHQRGNGSRVLYGSYPYPNGIPIKSNQEYILVAAKRGSPKYPAQEIKEESKIGWDFFKNYGSSPWYVNGERNRNHPAPFPEEIPRRLITLFSFVGDTVLDPFAGSGTTLVAADKLNRNSIGIDINKDYCRMSYEKLKNIQIKLTGERSEIKRIGF